jgi:Phosphotransferase enzyme family
VTIPRNADADLAARDELLRDLALVLDGEHVAATLSEARPDLDVRAATATYVRYKPGTACIVAYRLQIADEEVAAYVRLQHPDGAAKLDKPVGRGDSPGPLGTGAVPLPGLSAMLYGASHDRRIAAMPALVDPARRPHLLERAVPDCPELWNAAMHPLRWKPERRFVARLEGADGMTAVLKAFATEHERHRQSAVALGGGGRPRTPVLLGGSRRHAVLVNEWLPGVSLADAPSRDGAGLAGQAIAGLHRRSVSRLPIHGTERERHRLLTSAETIGLLDPSLGGDAQRLALDLAEALAPARPAPIHGDFSADQVLIHDDRAALVDLDESALGDPVSDLGGFVASLEYDVVLGTLTREAADALRCGLLVGYGGVAPGPLATWAAAALLHRAPEPFRSRRPGWGELLPRLVARASELAAAR